ncbi:hypothetical protein MCL27_17930 [Acinetobacter pittii]|uniref:hypothetical protein n=1 Tax=Acinetobacter pittii TaxID=48296 RepID=UPI001EE62E5A|nr:hypothetical protein [Acinetobacter pittii]MCG5266903.1 hypothetical protein [Acinetobacter pittii]
MEIQNLPMFKELSRVLCSYKIESWQTVDFWDKVKLLKIENTNINYQSVYRLILRLVKEGYLTIDFDKSRYGQTTYSEAVKLHDLRSQFCVKSISSIKELNDKREEFKCKSNELEEEINALEELKDQFSNLHFKIEQLQILKTKKIYKLRSKINAIKSLLAFLEEKDD